MSELPDESVHCVTTSPPYWGKRKYEGNKDLIWGGDKECQHQWVSDPIPGEKSGPHGPNATVGARFAQDAVRRRKPTNTCSLCGAWKGQFGLEPTPELYVQHTIEILREIRRVLRKDGVVFWNIGDSYGSGKGTCFNPGGGKGSFSGHGDRKDAGAYPLDRGNVSMLKASGLKPKDLCLIPFRVAIAAQEEGWWVRSVIIWNKPNPMPESVRDRPTNSYEFILMLTKSGSSLFWTHRDSGGTRQKPKADYRWVNQLTQEEVAIEPRDWKVKIKCPKCMGVGTIGVYLGLDVWQTVKCPTCNGKKETQLWKRINLWEGHDYYWDAEAVREISQLHGNSFGSNQKDTAIGHGLGSGNSGINAAKARARANGGFQGRNLRDVWTFPTSPFPSQFVEGEKLDHFAVFPEKLPELCIKAATSEKGCCPKCGAPWANQEESSGVLEDDIRAGPCVSMKTLGWRPTCTCGLDPIPCTVLDPFMGSGTTLLVATKLGRKSIGYDISESYCKMTVNRNRQGAL